MARTHRWIARIPARAAACRIRMPWQRGLRRTAFIRRRAGRAEPASLLRSA